MSKTNSGFLGSMLVQEITQNRRGTGKKSFSEMVGNLTSKIGEELDTPLNSTVLGRFWDRININYISGLSSG